MPNHDLQMRAEDGEHPNDNLNWNTLIGKIKQGNCTPILGAGASLPVLPLGGSLAEELLREEERASGPSPLIDRHDLAKVCQYIAVKRTDGLWPKSRIRENLLLRGSPDPSDANEPHKVLASLNLPVYVTTNYDNFMYKALRQVHPNAKQEFARWTS